jgi:hypothetical protein
MAEETKNGHRPFRLWDSKAKVYLRSRNFRSLVNAHHTANNIVADKNPHRDVGYTVEVLDASRGEKWLGTYRRTTHGTFIERIKFSPEVK